MNMSFGHDGLQFAWDATSISLAQTCLRKYQLKMLEGWAPRGNSVHLRFGGHYASALEHFHKHRALGMSHDEALFTVVKEALVDTWDYTPVWKDDEQKMAMLSISTTREDMIAHGVAFEGKAWESGHNTKTRENLIRSIIWYFDHFEDEPMPTVILSNGIPAVEYSFLLPVDNGLTFSGHIDRLVEYSGGIYVQDQKTTGTTISTNFFKQFSPNTQMSMYTFAGKAAFSIPVKGVVIDATQIAVGFTRFERGFTWRTDSELTEWYDEAMYHIETARTATREKHFPKNPASCGNYGGCEFRDICGRSPEVRPLFLAADFDRGPTWDPMKRR